MCTIGNHGSGVECLLMIMRGQPILTSMGADGLHEQLPPAPCKHACYKLCCIPACVCAVLQSIIHLPHHPKISFCSCCQWQVSPLQDPMSCSSICWCRGGRPTGSGAFDYARPQDMTACAHSLPLMLHTHMCAPSLHDPVCN